MTCMPSNSRKRPSLKSLMTRRRCWTRYAARSRSPDQKRALHSQPASGGMALSFDRPWRLVLAFMRIGFPRLTLRLLSCLFRAPHQDAQMTAVSSKNERYNPREAEIRWQRVWAERGIFSTKNDDPRPKYYVLEMFPYPSGRIHM